MEGSVCFSFLFVKDRDPRFPASGFVSSLLFPVIRSYELS